MFHLFQTVMKLKFTEIINSIFPTNILLIIPACFSNYAYSFLETVLLYLQAGFEFGILLALAPKAEMTGIYCHVQ